MSTKVAGILDNPRVPGAPMVRNKTPVTCLQELCTKRGITPVYELLANEGQVHEPMFMFRVTVGNNTAEGKGTSKKRAKHTAAALLLKQLLPQPADIAQSCTSCASSVKSLDEDGENEECVNYVGELQELSQRHLWPLPTYDCNGEFGPAHEREFVCSVRLFNLSMTGTGRSKKVAKRKAAANLLEFIKTNTDVKSFSSIYSSNNIDDVNSEFEQTLEEIQNMIISLKRESKIPTVTPADSQEISHFYQGLKYRTGKTLASLQVLALNIPATNYCQMLQEIAEEQNFEIVYVDIPQSAADGLCQCLVQLSSMPVAVCQGIGHSKAEARSLAAHNALQYLRIMTRK